MKKKISLNMLLETLNNQKHKKDIKLIVEGKVDKSKQHSIQIRGIEISKELFKELGFKEKTRSKGGVTMKPKQPTNKELLMGIIGRLDKQDKFNERQQQFNEQVSGFIERQEKVNERQEKFNQILINLPTIKKEINRTRSRDKDIDRKR